MHSARNKIEKHLFIVAGVITALIGFAITEYVVKLDRERHTQYLRANMVEQLATVRARLEGELNSTLHLTRGLIAYVSTHPKLDQDEFEQIAAELTSIGKHIRNIGLAPDNRISYVYPLIGNERAIGVHYQDLPEQWPAVQRAMELGSTVVAGPVNLVQGGEAFIARTPIYVRQDTESGNLNLRYWGIASIVLQVQSLFHAAGIDAIGSNMKLAIRGKDALGDKGDMIYGDPQLFLKEPVLQEVLLPNGNWELAAVPAEGWNTVNTDAMWRRGLGWLTSLVIAVLIAMLIRARHISRHLSMHDQLTGLPNRRLLDDRLEQLRAQCDRNGGRFTLLYLDLNGFKQVNDDHGHSTGDQVLREIGQRLGTMVRKGDTVTRIGGDEFLIVLANTHLAEDINTCIAKLREVIKTPIYAAGNRFTLDASIGVARYPNDAADITHLMAVADKRMYASKHNKVTPLHRA